MSADNGIYIAKFPDGYRVIHAQAIENLDYYPAWTKEWKDMLDSYYGNAAPIPSMSDALKEASRLSKEYYVLEYGICTLGEFDYIPKRKNK